MYKDAKQAILHKKTRIKDSTSLIDWVPSLQDRILGILIDLFDGDRTVVLASGHACLEGGQSPQH